jgi:cell wall-associated NlpC family hydrolase
MSTGMARRVLLLIALLITAAVAMPSPAAASAAPQTEADQILAIAYNQLGDKYSWAATGPNTFDCSGFVTFVYKQADLLDRIGGKRRTVRGFYKWFKNHDQIAYSLSKAQPGDLLVWGRKKHIGIYVGDGWAISALINPYGVTLHKVNKIHLKLKAVLKVKLER